MTNKNFINLGSVDQVALGHGHCFVVQGKSIAVFRPRTHTWVALENTCPHQDGPLADGILGDGKIVCPLHGHKFDLQTGEGSEERECVKVFEVEEKNGEIYLIL